MSNSMSAEEVAQEYVTAMGPELGPLFHALSIELLWTVWRWDQSRILFEEKPGRVELLNEAAPLFFSIVQDVFFEDTLLAVARLAGPAPIGRQRHPVHRPTAATPDGSGAPQRGRGPHRQGRGRGRLCQGVA
jgi:hypothetical protein